MTQTITWSDSEVAVPLFANGESPDLPTVYVCAVSRWSSEDYGGVSVSAEHGALFSHVSSSLGFLASDTTVGFADRAARLRELFPAGFVREVVNLTDPAVEVPAPIAHLFTRTAEGEATE